jgi:hypothetical protein
MKYKKKNNFPKIKLANNLRFKSLAENNKIEKILYSSAN